MTARIRSLVILAFVAALILPGCTHHAFELPFEPAPKPDTAPRPDTPDNAIGLLMWCWENRDNGHYRQLFTADYVFQSDTTGAGYRQTATWGITEEIMCMRNVTALAESVGISFQSSWQVLPDPRDGKTYASHRMVSIPEMRIFARQYDGYGHMATGNEVFYLVRGDSALLPSLPGVTADSTRWYVERWEDIYPPVPATVRARPSGPLAARGMPYTWGMLKWDYLIARSYSASVR